jgi:hypothetical protein
LYDNGGAEEVYLHIKWSGKWVILSKSFSLHQLAMESFENIYLPIFPICAIFQFLPHPPHRDGYIEVWPPENTENRERDVVALHVQYVHYKNTVINI